MERTQKEEVINILSRKPSKESLLELISWLDLGSISYSVVLQILARSHVAMGYALSNTVESPIKEAEVFAMNPTEANSRAYVTASTNTYPSGPGDGCYAIPETGFPGCEPGSGCRTGSGFLYFYHQTLESEGLITMEVIARELLPWLHGEFDPLAKRLERS